MSARTTRRATGFTLFELTIAVAASLASMGAAVALWDTTERLSDTSRTAMRSESEHRANLSTVSALFRDAVPDTLAGFDVDGNATQPRFQRVVGLSGLTPLEGPEQTVLWAAVSAWGVDDRGVPLGQVLVRASGAADRVLARHVPQGGFTVARSGRTLTLSLTTYYRSRESEREKRVDDVVEICLRN